MKKEKRERKKSGDTFHQKRTPVEQAFGSIPEPLCLESVSDHCSQSMFLKDKTTPGPLGCIPTHPLIPVTKNRSLALPQQQHQQQQLQQQQQLKF